MSLIKKAEQMVNLTKFKNKKEKGVAGLDIFLSVIAMIFVIGIIVMALVLTSSAMQESTNDTTAQQIMNETSLAIASATDWFGIFITIAAVVVLIILIIMIVVSLRNGGLMGGGAGA